jgi:cell wall-associated NlpC family hydrolase
MKKTKLTLIAGLLLPCLAAAMPPLSGELAGFDVEGRIDYLSAESARSVTSEHCLDCSGPASAMNTFTSEPDLAEKLLERARSQLHSMYRYGGTSPDTGFDCSGFVSWIYSEVVRTPLPRGADAIYKIDAPRVSPAHLEPGDLMFFRISGNRISHVTMYVGDRKFIHATRAGQPLRIESMDLPYWRQRFAGAKRLLGTDFLKREG